MQGFGELTEKLRRSTVQVRSRGNRCGSGVIWSQSGQIVTNAHVIGGGETQVELWSGSQFPAQIVKSDRRSDLALLRIDTTNLEPVTHGDSNKLRPGELAIAVGSPFGFVGAVSTGVIHTTGLVRGFGNRPWVVSNVRLAPGNSGGPLANARGEVVGINTMIVGGLGMAISSNSVEQFVTGSLPNRAELGVVVRPIRMPGFAGNFGLLVLEIVPHSAAERASLLPGDILVGAEKRAFRSLADLGLAIEASRQGPLEIEFLRGENRRTRRVIANVGIASGRAA